VRRAPEWQAAHIRSALNHALDGFKTALPDLPPGEVVVVMCKSGYRGSIASSLLLRAGFTNVINLTGGFDAWEGAGLPVVSEEMTPA
jgi:hydroxyacylglutathione hydrolase